MFHAFLFRHARARTHTNPSSFTPQPNPVYPPQLSSPPLLSCCLQRIFLSFAAKKRILKGRKRYKNSPCSWFFFLLLCSSSGFVSSSFNVKSPSLTLCPFPQPCFSLCDVTEGTKAPHPDTHDLSGPQAEKITARG